MIQQFIQLNSGYVIRSEVYENRSYIVVPVVMMVEGVHDGSQGPLLHLAEDLGRFPESWDGIPVMVQHPTVDGKNVSANIPKILAVKKVGQVFNTRMDGDKLRAEVWLDEKRLQEVSEIALQAIREQVELQVSVGVFTEEENVPGEWHGESYESIARNHRPDHLALLPGGTGACSWDDGCGIRTNVNKKGAKDVKKSELNFQQVKMYDSQNTIVDHITDNENGYREMIQLVQAELDSKDTQVKYHYLVELYGGKLIYEVRMQGEGTAYYQQNYTISTNDEVEFVGDPVEVQREVNFVVLEGSPLKRTKFSNNNNQKKEVKTMSKKEETPCRITELINNELTKFTEDDREWLKTLEETVLDKLIPNEPKLQANKKADEDKVKALQIDAKQSKQEPKKELTLDEYLEGVPEGMRDSMRAGLKLHEEQREKMIKEILTNTEKGVWDEDDLKVMETSILKKVFDSVKTEEVDFSALSIHGTEGGGKPGLLLPPGIKKESKKN